MLAHKKKRSRRDNEAKYAKPKTEVHLKSFGSHLPDGPWNEDETLLLVVLIKLIRITGMDSKLLPQMYNNYFEYNSNHCINKLDIRWKSGVSVNSKLRRMKEQGVL